METTAYGVETRDGITVSVDRYRGGPHESETAVVICPGFFKSKETRTFKRIAIALVSERRDVICMDFRGHGRSGGRYTFTAREGADLAAVLDWIRPRYRRVGVVGFSLGGAVAINTVGRYRDLVASLVAVSAPCVFRDIEFKFWTVEAIRNGIIGLEPGAGCRIGSPFLQKDCPLETVARLDGVPKLFIHGTRDVIVGIRHSHRLHEAAGEPKRLEMLEDGSHAEAMFRADPAGFSGLINAWLAQTLP